MKNLKKILVVGSALLMLTSGLAFAEPGNGLHLGTDDNPGLHLGWGDGDNNLPNPCEGPNCSAEGNFNISTFAAGGGFDIDGKIVPNGAAGGLGAAGGISVGVAQGEAVPTKFLWWTIPGEAEANLTSIAGGMSDTDYRVTHPAGRNSIAVGSKTDTYATAAGHLDVRAIGKSHAEGIIAGAAGQASLNASIMTKSLNKPWDSNGLTLGLAGQGSAGYFIGGGIAAGLGSAAVGAGLDMSGFSYSESYRIKDGNTEILGTEVGAKTIVTSYKYTDTCLIGVAEVTGGYVVAGGAASKTIQGVNNGVAVAKAAGGYVGAGELGCSFNGSAVGYTQTSATSFGNNGSIMSSSAGMRVTVGPVNDQQIVGGPAR